MGYLASHIATVPKRGYEWYAIFLERAFADDLKKAIDKNFATLAGKVGRETLIVRGIDPDAFKQSVWETPDLFDGKPPEESGFPLLIVTNRVPNEAVNDANMLQKGKVIIFRLGDIYAEHRSLSNFLGDLVQALNSKDALEALDTLNKKALNKYWGWLPRYFKAEPSFFGFGVKLFPILHDLFRSKSQTRAAES